ncbi:MAG: hypothetical protein LJE69_18815 [Thiohalocapsa sp.]|uniref:hypothetical protein n=1 Tax=Thiohalocapsa sp. TaxID=2497641 RepID=UPI0025CD20D2|nr:hypothetical protein [Thiohalocapsa sp.]MCG6943289.1 hypothetical protein [Thiohalocapsa sp.]
MTQRQVAAMCDGLEVGFDLDIDELRQLPAEELEMLRDLLPAGQLPPPLLELRRRLDRCADAAGTLRLKL